MAAIRNDDWVGFNCGDPVHRLDDHRHEGRVCATFGDIIRVEWEQDRADIPKWKSDERRADLYNMRTGRPR